MELQDFILVPQCDDGTLTGFLSTFMAMVTTAAAENNRPLDCVRRYKEWMQDAGFESVEEKTFRLPQNVWPGPGQQPPYKEIGAWVLQMFLEWVEGLSMALCTRVFGTEKLTVMESCRRVKEDLKNRRIHAYFKLSARPLPNSTQKPQQC